ncbi:hypothetical protein C5167_028845 [Papaver somniferum]|nr:hypothetical protein C5167_028845 [Papaver somniferum]
MTQIPDLVPSKTVSVKQNRVSNHQTDDKEFVEDVEKQEVKVIVKKKKNLFSFNPVKSFGNSMFSSVSKELKTLNKRIAVATSRADMYHETMKHRVRVAENGVKVAESGVRVGENMVFWFRGLVLTIGVIAIAHFHRGQDSCTSSWLSWWHRCSSNDNKFCSSHGVPIMDCFSSLPRVVCQHQQQHTERRASCGFTLDACSSA